MALFRKKSPQIVRVSSTEGTVEERKTVRVDLPAYRDTPVARTGSARSSLSSARSRSTTWMP